MQTYIVSVTQVTFTKKDNMPPWEHEQGFSSKHDSYILSKYNGVG